VFYRRPDVGVTCWNLFQYTRGDRGVTDVTVDLWTLFHTFGGTGFIVGSR